MFRIFGNNVFGNSYFNTVLQHIMHRCVPLSYFKQRFMREYKFKTVSGTK